MQRPEVQASTPLHGAPSPCFAAQVSPSQNPDWQSPSAVQDIPFRCWLQT
jgi:hypothetical protein